MVQNRTVSKQRQQAPHPIPAGSEGKVCPISGLFADVSAAEQEVSTALAFFQLESDPDISEERKTLLHRSSQTHQSLGAINEARQHLAANEDVVGILDMFVPLNVTNGAHRPNSQTRELVRVIGGLSALRRFTTIFYKKAFADTHLDQFIRRHSDPHGKRFAAWIMEKFGEGTPWTDELKSRPSDMMQIGSNRKKTRVAFDRSSSHLAAWFSPKREPEKVGQHFTPEDARVWMRLHFWAAREAGLFDAQNAAFMDYYIRFIGHFISVYSSKAPPFTRESARWSADPRNIEVYLASGKRMTDVIDKPVEDALAKLPQNECYYTGSRANNRLWPYDEPIQPRNLPR
jgi:truncated hemoglobin YjbI